MNPQFETAHKLTVRTSCDESFIHRVATQDCLMFVNLDYFNDDFYWRQVFRYSVKKLTPADRNYSARANYEVTFYLFNVSGRAKVIESILEYFHYSMVAYQEGAEVPLAAYTRQDIKRLFRKGNKLVRRAINGIVSPIGDIDNNEWRFQNFLTKLPEATYDDAGETIYDLQTYFESLFSEGLIKAYEAYHRPIVRGRDGYLYSAADMDNAMMHS
jgi:hypothetical protein